jgi:hypothetical protein
MVGEGGDLASFRQFARHILRLHKLPPIVLKGLLPSSARLSWMARSSRRAFFRRRNRIALNGWSIQLNPFPENVPAICPASTQGAGASRALRISFVVHAGASARWREAVAPDPVLRP